MNVVQPKSHRARRADGAADDLMSTVANVITPRSHHLDRRATSIVGAAGALDDLLTTRETADWLGVSVQWLEIGRSKKYGPPFTRISARCIRYRCADVVAWLKQRTFASTAEYGRKVEVA